MHSSMANRIAAVSSCYIHNNKTRTSPPPLLTLSDTRPSYNSLAFQAARLLGPPARFEASKLKVLFTGESINTRTRVIPRTYTLSHCDFTADLTLTISSIIQRDQVKLLPHLLHSQQSLTTISQCEKYMQLKGWYSKDDVVAEWTNVNGEMFLNIHCYVSGPNPLSAMAAELRYLIFSKELPLVLEAVLYGDAEFLTEHGELMDALVRVYFHSSNKKYNRMECWGPLKDAALGKGVDMINGYLYASRETSTSHKFWGSPKSIFQALVAFLL